MLYFAITCLSLHFVCVCVCIIYLLSIMYLTTYLSVIYIVIHPIPPIYHLPHYLSVIYIVIHPSMCYLYPFIHPPIYLLFFFSPQIPSFQISNCFPHFLQKSLSRRNSDLFCCHPQSLRINPVFFFFFWRLPLD